MKVVTGPRQSGKTTEAIRLANEADAHLAVHTHERAEQVYHDEDYPDLERFPITYRELRKGHRGTNRRVVIDDLEMLLSSTFELPIEAFTMTADETVILSRSDR